MEKAGSIVITDQDFTPREQTAEEVRREDSRMRDALMQGDLATFSVWQQMKERELGDSPDPAEKGKLLFRIARIYQAANEYESATTIAVRAAVLLKGKDPQTEPLIRAFIREVGGEKGLEEIKNQEIRALRERNTALQQEIIGFTKNKTEEKLTQEERDHRAALKQELNAVIRKERELRG